MCTRSRPQWYRETNVRWTGSWVMMHNPAWNSAGHIRFLSTKDKIRILFNLKTRLFNGGSKLEMTSKMTSCPGVKTFRCQKEVYFKISWVKVFTFQKHKTHFLLNDISILTDLYQVYQVFLYFRDYKQKFPDGKISPHYKYFTKDNASNINWHVIHLQRREFHIHS